MTPRAGVDYLVDYYAVLRVARGASAGEIKQAFKLRRAEYHPDRLEGMAEELRSRATNHSTLLNEAYAVLGNSQKRADYDNQLSSWQGPLSTDGMPIVSVHRSLSAIRFLVDGGEPGSLHPQLEAMIESLSGGGSTTMEALRPLVEGQRDVAPALLNTYREAILRQLATEEIRREHQFPDFMPERSVVPHSIAEIEARIEGARERVYNELTQIAGQLKSGEVRLLAGETQEPVLADGEALDRALVAAHHRFDQYAAAFRESVERYDQLVDRLASVLPVRYLFPEEPLFKHLLVIVEAPTERMAFLLKNENGIVQARSQPRSMLERIESSRKEWSEQEVSVVVMEVFPDMNPIREIRAFFELHSERQSKAAESV
ncbi:MAG: DnaJ domain-containing protein [Deltaproteobacteria bacterium]|nr:DnaJ domain-containing protein [Deltaproteobacteria bacterium]